MAKDAETIGPLILRAKIEHWPLVAPFRITGRTWERLDVLVVSLESNGLVGSGEAAGVYYKNDTPATMIKQIMGVRGKIELGQSRESVQKLLPAGGARNALDCAIWDLEAKVSGTGAWQIARLAQPKPLLTTFTCSADTPEKMAATAKGYKDARAIKVKLTGSPEDAGRVQSIREVKPDAWLGIDGNQGFTRAGLERLLPALIDARVSLIEQPFKNGEEFLLDGFSSPIPVAADESAQSLLDIPGLVGRFQVVNIKLDKCGGLTEALAIARSAHELGLDCMVGNMLGTSLAMAPAYLLGQLCKVVDLDGPIFLKSDREITVRYSDGLIACPDEIWGYRTGQGEE
jgi:L-alanine-DL-glutamate epimerase-like enolase superfamily enzyme